eukprot:TRINITY_DN11310_c0_g1_i1.p1 TRINITY_DN11310_c0_g1~~TRINITY_DN11310_c0_g1_i1.p1  ORF type:complete len:242 (+),score=33.41 TRINITY_DN11310_c0_g1_i1:61-726(+)
MCIRDRRRVHGMDKDHYDYLFKFIVIGNANSGKSCFLHYLLENKFKRNSSHTIGVEFGSKIIKIGSKTVKLQIWDTAGQERFRAVARTYYRGALGALILYDITNPDSYNSLSQWIKDARDLARPDICIFVIGNKSDLKDQRQVSNVEAAKFCQENGVSFLEASALTGENVIEGFQGLTKNILGKIDSGLIDTSELQPRLTSTLTSTPQKKKESSCPNCSRS